MLNKRTVPGSIPQNSWWGVPPSFPNADPAPKKLVMSLLVSPKKQIMKISSSNTGYLSIQPIRIAYFKHVIALDQSEGWI